MPHLPTQGYIEFPPPPPGGINQHLDEDDKKDKKIGDLFESLKNVKLFSNLTTGIMK